MNTKLSSQIAKMVGAIRAHDLLWAAGFAALIGAGLIVAGFADWRVVLGAWLALGGALFIRNQVSPLRAYAEPIIDIVDKQLAVRRSGLADLRIARDVPEALPDPLFILDTDGIVEYANPAAKELVGSDNIEGRHFAAALRATDVFEAAEAVIKTQEPQTVDFVTTGSVERSCRALVAPLGAKSGEGLTRALIFVHDLTSERRVERMRADFIASASHELRTPIASLLGFIETMRGHAKDDPAAREKFLGIMQSQAERMQRLVSDLMSLSRIELNEHVPPKGNVDLADLAGDVIDSLAPLLERAGAIVDFLNETDLPTKIRGDRDELFQAAQNLLDNAVKYGGDPAMIKVRVGRGSAPALGGDGEPAHRAGDAAAQTAARLNVPVDDLVYIQIRDFGPGIERADLPRLTERFYRVDLEQSRKSGGTGLGLAIVKHIANRHQGGFQIESRSGGGTAFSCHFLAADRSAPR